MMYPIEKGKIREWKSEDERHIIIYKVGRDKRGKPINETNIIDKWEIKPLSVLRKKRKFS